MAGTDDNVLASQIEIKVGGSALQDTVMNSLIEVVVDQHALLPHMFTICLKEEADKLSYIDKGPFDLTKEVEITAVVPATGAKTLLIKGEVTALEPMFGEDMSAELVVRGYDKSHRLYRETKSAAFLNKKDSDLASTFAGSAGLSAQVDATSTVYEHIYQDNQTDLAFLMQRAWRIGYECFVEDGKLFFRKPPTGSGSTTLKWGEGLQSFAPRMTLAEQVDEVMVKGWDATKQEAIVGKATAGTLYPSIGEAKKGNAWASGFGTGKRIFVDQPVVSQAEANLMAQARLNEISGAFVVATGIAYRRPDVKAGAMIKLEGLGTRMSGSYLVTQATHSYRSTEGYETKFTVRGARTGLISEQAGGIEPVKRWNGVVTAVVTNADDPDATGRVKVKYPWMSDEAESDWARVASIGAGPEAGLLMTPDVNDEVVISFEHGDFNRPVVLGGLWSGKNKLPAEGAGAPSGEQPLIRTWHSRTGHFMAMYDNADKKVEIITVDGHTIMMDDANKKLDITTSGGHSVTLDDQGKKLEIKTSGGHKITLDDNGRKATVESSGDVEIKAGTNMKLTATANIDIEATGNLTIKSNGPLNVQSSAITAIKGSLVQIN